MDNNKFQELVLQQFQAISDELKNLNDGQSRIESRMDRLESKVDKLELRMEDSRLLYQLLQYHRLTEYIKKMQERVVFMSPEFRQQRYNCWKN